jgi:hypothetical protein
VRFSLLSTISWKSYIAKHTMQLLWPVNQTFSQTPEQHVGPDMSDAEYLSETSCGDKHVSETNFQCLDHVDVMPLGTTVEPISQLMLSKSSMSMNVCM